MNLFNPTRRLSFPADNPRLAGALHHQSRAYLAQHRDHRYADGRMWLKMLALIGGCIACYGAALRQSHTALFMLWYLATMVFAMLLAVNVVHDASHNAFLRGKRANAWLNRIVAVPLGLDPDCWRVRHVRYHHGYTNIEFYDPDTAENGLLRQTPWQRWRPFMRAQRYYWPLVAALTFPWYIWVVDWLDRGGMTPVTPHLAQQGVAGWGVFLLGKAAHTLLALVLPAVCMADKSALAIVAVYLVCQMVSSFIFVMLIVGTHWAKGRVMLPPVSGKMPEGRLAHIFATTFDWTMRPAGLGYWLGGINLHLTHHLFPHWNHRHYPALSRIIKEIAHREGMACRTLSLGDLLSLQQRFLQRMGERPAKESESR